MAVLRTSSDNYDVVFYEDAGAERPVKKPIQDAILPVVKPESEPASDELLKGANPTSNLLSMSSCSRSPPSSAWS